MDTRTKHSLRPSGITHLLISTAQIVEDMVFFRAVQLTFTEVGWEDLRLLQAVDGASRVASCQPLLRQLDQRCDILAGDFALAAFPRVESACRSRPVLRQTSPRFSNAR